jgi:OmpA-OmpF porin, OOP family
MNLMDAVKGQLSQGTVDKAAAETGESPDGTRKAMHGAVAAIFAGLTQHASSGGGAAQILGLLGGGGVSGAASGLAGRLTGAAGGEAPSSAGGGQGLISKIFGERSGAVTNSVAESSGIKSSSASHVLSLIAPMVAGVVGKEVFSNHMDAGGLSRMLLGHKQAIAQDPSTPRGLAGALGLGRLSDLGGSAVGASSTETEVAEAETRPAREVAVGRPLERAEQGAERVERQPERLIERERQPRAPDKKRSGWAWTLPILLLGALAVWGIFAFFSGLRTPAGVTAPQATVPNVNVPHPVVPGVKVPAAPNVNAPAAPNVNAPNINAPPSPMEPAAPAANEPQTPNTNAPPGAPEAQGPSEPSSAAGSEQIRLPGGAWLNVDKDGPQAHLAKSLASSSETLPRSFHFKALTFDTGAATLSAGSNANKTMDDLAAMLKAYPNSRIRLVGHTDSNGDPADNKTLSAARASAVEHMLVQRGVAAARIETAGKSDNQAVAGNDTEEGRARNRRVDVVLLSR